jgi:hypothetical protein
MKRRKGLVGLSVGIIMFLAVLAVPFTACAGGGQAYPQGADMFFLGAVPPPGVYLKLYTVYKHAENLKDNDGNTMTYAPGVPGDANILKDLSVWVNTLRTIWISDKKILGAFYGQQLFIPWVRPSIETNAAPGLGIPASKDSQNNIGDLTYSPLLLSWHFSPFFHAVFALDIYIPVGPYDASSQINVSKNAWTIEPKFGVSYFLPVHPQLAFGALVSYAHNYRTQQTDVTTGDEVHVQYSIDYGFTKTLRAGIGGYWLQQLGDDKNDRNSALNNTDKTSAFAVGPGVWYQWDKFIFDLHTYWEVQTKNNPQMFTGVFAITYTI